MFITPFLAGASTKKFSVSFNLNGGTSSAIASQVVKKGKTATAPSNPSRTSYTFNGWFTSSSGGTKFDFSTPITSDIILYAQWTAQTKSLTVSSNASNMNLNTWAKNNGWDGVMILVVTINSGVYVYATATSTPALTVNGAFPNGVRLVNKGTILGRGGNGGTGGAPANTGRAGSAGSAGGVALAVSSAISVQNDGRISGGGGGGGGGGSNQNSAGGGGGGGIGGSSGGSYGQYGSGGATAGSAGTLTAVGTGGSGGRWTNSKGVSYSAGKGGNGGTYGTSGGGGSKGGSAGNGGAGGAAGACCTGNSFVTWTATGTRNGAIS